MSVGELGAELVMASVAVRAPIADGMKVTVAEQPWLGVRVVVEHGDITAKSAALMPVMAVLMPVTAAVPVLSSVRLSGAGDVTSMLPKARAPGVILSWPRAPMPVRETVSGSVVASVVRLRVPVRVPVAVGVKVTLREQVAFAARVEALGGQVLRVAM